MGPAIETKLSVNLNKIALLRNQRDVGYPSVLEAARLAVRAGAHGITVHPRPDERHIRRTDVIELAALIMEEFAPAIEYNIEGYPTPEFIALIGEVRPDQVTLVPDAPDQRTSDHGWDLKASFRSLQSVIRELKGDRRAGQPVHGPRSGRHRHRRVGWGRSDRAVHRTLRPRLCRRRRRRLLSGATSRPPKLRRRRVSASTPATTSISTTCRLSCRRSRSSPRSASATRSPPMPCASAFPPPSRPTCGRSGGSACRRTRRQQSASITSARRRERALVAARVRPRNKAGLTCSGRSPRAPERRPTPCTPCGTRDSCRRPS